MSTERPHRLRRDPPKQTGPERQFSKLYNQQDQVTSNSGSANSAGAADSSHKSGRWRDTINDSVKMGYRVIEEQIEQGQRIAQQINNGSYRFGATNANVNNMSNMKSMGSINVSNEVQDLARTAQRYFEDGAQLYMRMFDSMVNDFGPRDGGRGSYNPGNYAELFQLNTLMDTFAKNCSRLLTTDGLRGADFFSDASTGTHSSQEISSLMVSSMHPTEINLNIQSTARSYEVDRLYAKNPDIKPITDIRIGIRPDNKLRVELAVDPDQPTGDYSGIIHDATTRDHCGTITLRLYASADS